MYKKIDGLKLPYPNIWKKYTIGTGKGITTKIVHIEKMSSEHIWEMMNLIFSCVFFLSFVVVGIFIFKMNNRRDKNADHVQSFLPHLSTHTQFNTRYKKLYAVAWMWAISFEFDVNVDHVTNIVHYETHRDQMLTSHTQDSMKLNAILVMNWNWRETFCRRQKIATSH